MPGRYSERLTYAAPAGGCTTPPSMYGFSTGFTSIAFPEACTDHRGGPSATAFRQLKPDVLSAAIDVGSSPPKASIGSMRRMGNRPSYRRWKAVMTASVTSRWTTMAPAWGWLSNPHTLSRTRRSSSGPTGHPGRHDAPRSAAVTAATVALKSLARGPALVTVGGGDEADVDGAAGGVGGGAAVGGGG